MPLRTATPGVFKLPAGAAERERFRALDARVMALEKGGSSALLEAIEALTARVAALETARAKGGRPRKDDAQ